MTTELLASRAQSQRRSRVVKAWQLYAMLAAPVVWLIIFRYVPIYGVTIAFKDYSIVRGYFGSPWIGFRHFQRFFTSYDFWRIIGNTLTISFYQIGVMFPIPIIFALRLNYVNRLWYKKTLQLVTYAPYFISTVVMVGIIMQVLSVRSGVVNLVIKATGLEPVNFMGEPQLFSSVFVWSHVWQHMGFQSVIYIAALATIDPSLHEAAVIDGASKRQRMRYVDVPGILPIAMILLILSVGRMFEIGFEKILLMQNPLNLRASEIIDTYVYRIGILSQFPSFSYAAAIGLFKNVIGFILLLSVNRVAKAIGQSGVW